MATKTKTNTVLYIPYWSSLAMCNDSSSNPAVDKYFLFFIMIMFMYGRMASTLAMCVV